MSRAFEIIVEPGLAYHTMADQDLFNLISVIRKGISFKDFQRINEQLPFSMQEWSIFLCLSERTIQRYQKEGKTFDQPTSEKIIEILLLYRYGLQVFLDKTKFNLWLITQNLALGGDNPKKLLDNTFGINLLKDELFRIEQGLLA